VRILLTIIIPLLLPSIVYLMWSSFARQRARAKGEEPRPFGDGPWFWLAIGGFVLTLASLAAFYLVGSHEPGSVYIPPHMENGELVPGRYIEPDAQ